MLSQYYKIDSDVGFRTLSDGRVLVINVLEGIVHLLQDVEVHIWQELSSGLDFESIILSIMNEFEADEDLVRQDTCHFFEELLKFKLICNV